MKQIITVNLGEYLDHFKILKAGAEIFNNPSKKPTQTGFILLEDMNIETLVGTHSRSFDSQKIRKKSGERIYPGRKNPYVAIDHLYLKVNIEIFECK